MNPGSARASRAHFGALTEILGEKARDGEAPLVPAERTLAREGACAPRQSALRVG
jgi:hypothetical protein